MKIEIYNEYEPHSEYLKNQGKNFLAGIKEYWGEWADISFQTQKNEETELDQTLITIEFNDMSKLGTITERTEGLKTIYKPSKMWRSLVSYAIDSLSTIRFSNGDGIKATMCHPESVSPSVPTIILSWRCNGKSSYVFKHNPPFKIRLLDSHNKVWSQVGIGDEWFKPLQEEYLLTQKKHPNNQT